MSPGESFFAQVDCQSLCDSFHFLGEGEILILADAPPPQIQETVDSHGLRAFLPRGTRNQVGSVLPPRSAGSPSAPTRRIGQVSESLPCPARTRVNGPTRQHFAAAPKGSCLGEKRGPGGAVAAPVSPSVTQSSLSRSFPERGGGGEITNRETQVGPFLEYIPLLSKVQLIFFYFFILF